MGSRPPGQLRKRLDDRTSNASYAVQAAAGSQQTADASDLTFLSMAVSWLSEKPVWRQYLELLNQLTSCLIAEPGARPEYHVWGA